MVLLVAGASLAPRLFEILPRCGWKAIFGLPCPACGSSRALLVLGRGNVVEAFAVSPLAAASWILFFSGGLLAGAFALMGRRVPEPSLRLPAGLWWLLGLVVLANWVYLIADGR